MRDSRWRLLLLAMVIVFARGCACSPDLTNLGNNDGGGGGSDGAQMPKQPVHVVITDTCPGCPSFPADGTPACTDATRRPALLYPAAGTLLPPNVNVIEVQFDQAAGNTLFEVDFQNALTDVRVLTRCNAITDARKLATNGCAYDLDQRVWDILAQQNRGGDPLNISVRGTDDKSSCVAASPGRPILFGAEDLSGGIYYWQAVVLGGVQGKTGGIYRYDFGRRGQAPETFLAPSSSVNKCIGCHFLSRDGQKMSFGSDDADADDEYADLHGALIDVASKKTSGSLSPGFQTFSPQHKLLLASDGKGQAKPPAFSLFDGETGAAASPATVPSGSARGTHPDWSPDGTKIVFVQPKTFLASLKDDDHFTGGSLFSMSYDANGNKFGTPQPLLMSQGENNYYPAYSPDGNFVIFNRVPGGGTDLSQDGFANPNAHVLLLPPKAGAQPIDLPALNDRGPLTNSWPRWSPAIQTYKGHKLVWVTFSSTRDYGVRIRNGIQVKDATGKLVDQVNCYPPESPLNPNNNKNEPLGPECHQPQIWMAAIDLSVAESGTGDPSYPAFWLPFQSATSHNHIAQWVVTVVGSPGTPDGGTCIPLGSACSSANANCCGGVCVGNTCNLP